MINVIELLGEQLKGAAQQIENRLMDKYAITSFQIQVSNLYNTYNLNCIDSVKDFVMSSDDNLETALVKLEKQLIPRSEIAKSKRAKAEKLLKEAESAELKKEQNGNA